MRERIGFTPFTALEIPLVRSAAREPSPSNVMRGRLALRCRWQPRYAARTVLIQIVPTSS
jgi:hypothetical protein